MADVSHNSGSSEGFNYAREMGKLIADSEHTDLAGNSFRDFDVPVGEGGEKITMRMVMEKDQPKWYIGKDGDGRIFIPIKLNIKRRGEKDSGDQFERMARTSFTEQASESGLNEERFIRGIGALGIKINRLMQQTQNQGLLGQQQFGDSKISVKSTLDAVQQEGKEPSGETLGANFTARNIRVLSPSQVQSRDLTQESEQSPGVPSLKESIESFGGGVQGVAKFASTVHGKMRAGNQLMAEHAAMFQGDNPLIPQLKAEIHQFEDQMNDLSYSIIEIRDKNLDSGLKEVPAYKASIADLKAKMCQLQLSSANLRSNLGKIEGLRADLELLMKSDRDGNDFKTNRDQYLEWIETKLEQLSTEKDVKIKSLQDLAEDKCPEPSVGDREALKSKLSLEVRVMEHRIYEMQARKARLSSTEGSEEYLNEVQNFERGNLYRNLKTFAAKLSEVSQEVDNSRMQIAENRDTISGISSGLQDIQRMDKAHNLALQSIRIIEAGSNEEQVSQTRRAELEALISKYQGLVDGASDELTKAIAAARKAAKEEVARGKDLDEQHQALGSMYGRYLEAKTPAEAVNAASNLETLRTGGYQKALTTFETSCNESERTMLELRGTLAAEQAALNASAEYQKATTKAIEAITEDLITVGVLRRVCSEFKLSDKTSTVVDNLKKMVVEEQSLFLTGGRFSADGKSRGELQQLYRDHREKIEALRVGVERKEGIASAKQAISSELTEKFQSTKVDADAVYQDLYSQSEYFDQLSEGPFKDRCLALQGKFVKAKFGLDEAYPNLIDHVERNDFGEGLSGALEKYNEKMRILREMSVELDALMTGAQEVIAFDNQFMDQVPNPAFERVLALSLGPLPPPNLNSSPQTQALREEIESSYGSLSDRLPHLREKIQSLPSEVENLLSQEDPDIDGANRLISTLEESVRDFEEGKQLLEAKLKTYEASVRLDGEITAYLETHAQELLEQEQANSDAQVHPEFLRGGKPDIQLDLARKTITARQELAANLAAAREATKGVDREIEFRRIQEEFGLQDKAYTLIQSKIAEAAEEFAKHNQQIEDLTRAIRNAPARMEAEATALRKQIDDLQREIEKIPSYSTYKQEAREQLNRAMSLASKVLIREADSQLLRKDGESIADHNTRLRTLAKSMKKDEFSAEMSKVVADEKLSEAKALLRMHRKFNPNRVLFKRKVTKRRDEAKNLLQRQDCGHRISELGGQISTYERLFKSTPVVDELRTSLDRLSEELGRIREVKTTAEVIVRSTEGLVADFYNGNIQDQDSLDRARTTFEDLDALPELRPDEEIVQELDRLSQALEAAFNEAEHTLSGDVAQLFQEAEAKIRDQEVIFAQAEAEMCDTANRLRASNLGTVAQDLELQWHQSVNIRGRDKLNVLLQQLDNAAHLTTSPSNASGAHRAAELDKSRIQALEAVNKRISEEIEGDISPKLQVGERLLEEKENVLRVANLRSDFEVYCSEVSDLGDTNSPQLGDIGKVDRLIHEFQSYEDYPICQGALEKLTLAREKANALVVSLESGDDFDPTRTNLTQFLRELYTTEPSESSEEVSTKEDTQSVENDLESGDDFGLTHEKLAQFLQEARSEENLESSDGSESSDISSVTEQSDISSVTEQSVDWEVLEQEAQEREAAQEALADLVGSLGLEEDSDPRRGALIQFLKSPHLTRGKEAEAYSDHAKVGGVILERLSADITAKLTEVSAAKLKLRDATEEVEKLSSRVAQAELFESAVYEPTMKDWGTVSEKVKEYAGGKSIDPSVSNDFEERRVCLAADVAAFDMKVQGFKSLSLGLVGFNEKASEDAESSAELEGSSDSREVRAEPSESLDDSGELSSEIIALINQIEEGAELASEDLSGLKPTEEDLLDLKEPVDKSLSEQSFDDLDVQREEEIQKKKAEIEADALELKRSIAQLRKDLAICKAEKLLEDIELIKEELSIHFIEVSDCIAKCDDDQDEDSLQMVEHLARLAPLQDQSDQYKRELIELKDQPNASAEEIETKSSGLNSICAQIISATLEGQKLVEAMNEEFDSVGVLTLEWGKAVDHGSVGSGSQGESLRGGDLASSFDGKSSVVTEDQVNENPGAAAQSESSAEGVAEVEERATYVAQPGGEDFDRVGEELRSRLQKGFESLRTKGEALKRERPPLNRPLESAQEEKNAEEAYDRSTAQLNDEDLAGASSSVDSSPVSQTSEASSSVPFQRHELIEKRLETLGEEVVDYTGENPGERLGGLSLKQQYDDLSANVRLFREDVVRLESGSLSDEEIQQQRAALEERVEQLDKDISQVTEYLKYCDTAERVLDTSEKQEKEIDEYQKNAGKDLRSKTEQGEFTLSENDIQSIEAGLKTIGEAQELLGQHAYGLISLKANDTPSVQEISVHLEGIDLAWGKIQDQMIIGKNLLGIDQESPGLGGESEVAERVFDTETVRMHHASSHLAPPSFMTVPLGTSTEEIALSQAERNIRFMLDNVVVTENGSQGANLELKGEAQSTIQDAPVSVRGLSRCFDFELAEQCIVICENYVEAKKAAIVRTDTNVGSIESWDSYLESLGKVKALMKLNQNTRGRSRLTTQEKLQILQEVRGFTVGIIEAFGFGENQPESFNAPLPPSISEHYKKYEQNRGRDSRTSASGPAVPRTPANSPERSFGTVLEKVGATFRELLSDSSGSFAGVARESVQFTPGPNSSEGETSPEASTPEAATPGGGTSDEYESDEEGEEGFFFGDPKIAAEVAASLMAGGDLGEQPFE